MKRHHIFEGRSAQLRNVLFPVAEIARQVGPDAFTMLHRQQDRVLQQEATKSQAKGPVAGRHCKARMTFY